MDLGHFTCKQLLPTEGVGSQEQTISGTLTKTGATLGTLAYMSPEQLRGEDVDTRSDIFSFGIVLYEMLTRVHPFKKAQPMETGNAILNQAPVSLSQHMNEVPPVLQHTLRKMLAKEADRRFQHVDEVRIDLEELISEIADFSIETTVGAAAIEGTTVGVRAGKSWRQVLPWAWTAVLVLMAAVILWTYLRMIPPGRQPLSRLILPTPPLAVLVHGRSPVVALSTDGAQLVYVAGDTGIGQLYLRELGSLEATPIAGADKAQGPFFSPDGKWVAFFAGGKLKKVLLEGGLPVTVCDALGPHGGCWGADNSIVFGGGGNLWCVSADGGTPETVTTLDSEKGEAYHFWPEILPGGDAVVFTAVDTTLQITGIWVQSLDTGQRRLLVEGGGNARYVPSGHLVYASEGSLLAVPFDPERLELTGAAIPVIEGVMMGLPQESDIAHFAVSANGTLAYLPGAFRSMKLTLVWVDRKGQEEPLAVDQGIYYGYPRLSPDGARLAITVAIDDSDNGDVWIYDLPRETFTRLTFDPAGDGAPLWTPDGLRVVFASRREGEGYNLFWKPADGTGQAERLTTSPNDQEPYFFSPDGKRLVYVEYSETSGDIGVLSMEGERSSQPLLQTQFFEGRPAISPDGQWMAYMSDETGRREVYVRPFPKVEEGKWRISREGGVSPVWEPKGRELFYRSGEAMMVVRIRTEPTFTAGSPEVLFAGSYFTGVGGDYDISPDGQRFFMIKQGEQTEETSAPRELIVVLNWFEELKRLVPTGK